jgi:hypothetical protein
MDSLRISMRTQAVEIKSRKVLLPQHRQTLLTALSTVADRGNIYLLEKSYFVTAQLIDLLVAANAYDFDLSLASSGLGREIASDLHDRAPEALGTELWHSLLTTYNDLIRTYARAGSQAPTTEPFFKVLDAARQASTDEQVSDILKLVWESRLFAGDHEGERATMLRQMDPMAGTLNSVSMTWALRLGGRPFEFLLDEYGALNDATRELIIKEACEPLVLRGSGLPRADLRGIRFVDSRLDARVQVADILAGVGQELARLAESGVFDDDLQLAAGEMLDFNGMWSSSSPLDVLWERRPPFQSLRDAAS